MANRESRGHLEIQRCDACAKFNCDAAAGQAALRTLHAMTEAWPLLVLSLEACHESLTLVVAEGGDKCDPEGIGACIAQETQARENAKAI